MLRKIGLGLLCAGSLFATNVMAMNHELAKGMHMTIELKADKAEVFTNYTMFTVNATCTITSEDESNTIHVKALRRSGTINGQKVNAGDELDVIVKNGDKFILSAQSAAQVELSNQKVNIDQEIHAIKAMCVTG